MKRRYYQSTKARSMDDIQANARQLQGKKGNLPPKVAIKAPHSSSTIPNLNGSSSPVASAPATPTVVRSSEDPVIGRKVGTQGVSFGDNNVENVTSDNWATLGAKLKSWDENMVKNWNEEIDTLLVFAGLFSAVLTAFNIESYRALNLDSADKSLLVLQQIAQQLALNGNNGNSTQPLSIPQTFQPPRAVVRINILWFTSLFLSLISASLGMLVKQWLREYLAGDHASSRNQARVRQFRYRGVTKWRVFEIMAFLPSLLQISLILFLIGLIDFLRLVHMEVAAVISVLVGIWFFVYAATTFLPTIFPDCPYKSPQARLIYNIVRILKGEKPWRIRSLSPHLSWSRFERDVPLNQTLDIEALATADATFADDDSLRSLIGPCFKDLDGPAAVECLNKICRHRLQVSRLDSIGASVHKLSEKSLNTISSIVIVTLETAVKKAESIQHSASEVTWIEEAFNFLKEGITANREASILSSAGDIGKRFSKMLVHCLGVTNRPFVSEALDFLSSQPEVQVQFNGHRIPNLSNSISTMVDCAREMVFMSASLNSAESKKSNPLSLTAVVLSLIDRHHPLSLAEDSRSSLSEYLADAAKTITVLDVVEEALLQDCIKLTQKLNLEIPRIANNLLDTLYTIERQLKM
ncbi:hypothetical protein ABKN59_010096 [Abortiporus biennis]